MKLNLKVIMEEKVHLGTSNNSNSEMRASSPAIVTNNPLSFIQSIPLPQGSFLLSGILSEQSKKIYIPQIQNFPSSALSLLPSSQSTRKRSRDYSPPQSLSWKRYLQSIPNVRFVPKASSVRAITNLRTRKASFFRPRYTFNSNNNNIV